jgi:hypothetical protein
MTVVACRPAAILAADVASYSVPSPHSHSMVPGDLLVTS